MTVSILVVDDEPDVIELFRQRFRRETRRGDYSLHFAESGEYALEMLRKGIRPELILILFRHQYAWHGRPTVIAGDQARLAASHGDDGDGLRR
jgi:DNA-binding NtrC family response regulator